MSRSSPASGPAPTRPRGDWSLPVGLGATLVVGSVALLLRSPHADGSWGFCPSAMLGFACPGCGGLRGTYELLHGDVAGAWALNPLVVVGLPLVLVLIGRWTLDAVRRRPPWSPSVRVAAVTLGVLLVFTVARNTALLGPFLGPLAVP